MILIFRVDNYCEKLPKAFAHLEKIDDFKAKLFVFTAAEGKICVCSEIILQL